MINKHSDNIKNGHRISIILILCLFGFCLVQAMQAPKKRSKKRPDGDRVYLLHADELRYDMYGNNPDAQIVIFGKKGHAEVLGLVGQTESHAIVVEKFDEVKQLQEMGKLDFSKDIYLYSQTTKSLDEFHRIIDYCQEHIVDGATFKSFDTICRQVANRMPNIANFASKHDVILFVSGRKSSNGKVLFNECKSVNPNSYQIESADEINMDWVKNVKTVGICGATSTPKWLMEEIMNHLKNAIDQSE